MSTTIGTLKESSLHASVKQLYSRPGDLLEAKVDNSIIDIVRNDIFVEIQTGHFIGLKGKLEKHLGQTPILVVYPISLDKQILRIAKDGHIISSRKSPKHGKAEDLFSELVSIVKYVNHPNFSLEIVFIEEETIWTDDGRGSWRRRGWSILDRRLVKVMGRMLFKHPLDYKALIPISLKGPFTSYDLAKEAGLRRSLASKMVYCLKMMGVIELIGKMGRYNLYKKL